MAAEALPVVEKVVAVFASYFVNPAIYLIMAISVLIIFWGAFLYFFTSEDAAKRAQGGQLFIWGILGLAIMLSARGLVGFVRNSVSNTGLPTGPSWSELQR